jgi:hypothetical protein
VLLELGGRISELVYLLSVRFGGLIVLNLFTRHQTERTAKSALRIQLGGRAAARASPSPRGSHASAVPCGAGRTFGASSATTGSSAVRSVRGRWPRLRPRCYRRGRRSPAGGPWKTFRAANVRPRLCSADRPEGTVASVL